MPASKKKINNKKSQVGRKGGTVRKGLTEPYRHPTAESLMRPEVGTQAQFDERFGYWQYVVAKKPEEVRKCLDNARKR